MLSSQQSIRRTLPLAGLSVPALVLALAGSALAQTPTVPVAQVPDAVSQATLVGKPPQTQVLHFTVALPPADRTALQDYANRVSNPKDPLYRKFLKPTEVGDKFGPSAATVNTVTAYLKGKGFKIRLVNGSRLTFLADATVKSAETAFATTFGNFKRVAADDNVRPLFYANTTPLKLPETIAGKILTIDGGTNALKPRPAILTVTQTRSLYNTAPFYSTGFQGQGMKIGMVNYDGYRLSNVPLLYSQYGLPTPTGGVGKNITKVSISGFNGETQAAEGEGDLDIQMILGMAPLANLYIYDAPNTGPLATYTQQANDNLCDIISESWEYGISDANYISALHDLHLQMTAQGITYMSAAGDFGAIGRKTPYPHYDSEVLQIGGTIAQVDTNGKRTSEVTWSTVSGDASHLGGGGGWIGDDSSLNVRPPYQSTASPYNFGVRPDLNKRLFPDISFNAAGPNNGGAYYFYQDGTLSSGAVGTSFACPIFAGLLGVTVQKLENDGYFATGTGHRMGRLQDLIYQMKGDSNVYFDVTEGGIGPLPDGTLANAGAGWDFATGWGSMDMGAFEDTLIKTVGVSLVDTPADAAIYATSAPSVTYGTLAQGDASDLTTTDGLTYSVLSVKQTGVGQVAATEVSFSLQGDATTRRSATLKLALMSDSLTTEFIYLYNYTTGKYDLVKSLGGSGTMTSVSLALSESKYIQDNQVKVLARAIKPTRLGNVPFRITVDQATVTERVPTSS